MNDQEFLEQEKNYENCKKCGITINLNLTPFCMICFYKDDNGNIKLKEKRTKVRKLKEKQFVKSWSGGIGRRLG